MTTSSLDTPSAIVPIRFVVIFAAKETSFFRLPFLSIKSEFGSTIRGFEITTLLLLAFPTDDPYVMVMPSEPKMKTPENDSNVINIVKTAFISVFIAFLKNPDKLYVLFLMDYVILMIAGLQNRFKFDSHTCECASIFCKINEIDMTSFYLYAVN
jgi:hypothetical protein